MLRSKSHGAIDVGRVAEMAQSHPELPTEFDIRPPDSVLARGDMSITLLRDGVKVMRGRMRGLPRRTSSPAELAALVVPARTNGPLQFESVRMSDMKRLAEDLNGCLVWLT